MQTLLIRLFLDLPDINLFWHMRCCFSRYQAENPGQAKFR